MSRLARDWRAVPIVEKKLDEEIVEKGLTAPRITPEHINSCIIEEQFHVFPGTTVTVCCLTLKNGFNVTGVSASASVENFDEEIGRKIAFENARNEIWKLEGYLLKDSLAKSASPLHFGNFGYHGELVVKDGKNSIDVNFKDDGLAELAKDKMFPENRLVSEDLRDTTVNGESS